MTGRILALFSVIMVLALLVGCASQAELSTITVTPATAEVQFTGATAQFTATGTYVNGKKGTQYTQDLTGQVTWTSSVQSVATVNSAGLATAVAEGVTTITATGGNGSIAGSATLTVASNTGSGGTLTSITVIPNNQIVYQIGETAQYIAIGNYTGTPSTKDLTNQVSWSSSDVRIATINTGGLATGVGNCGSQAQQTTITALAPSSTGTALT